MPQLGESVTEGTVSKWLVSVGDKVNKYDPLAEVMTDKVTAEVPSSFTGTIKELNAAEGDTLAVSEIICTIEVEGGNTDENQEKMKGKMKKKRSKQHISLLNMKIKSAIHLLYLSFLKNTALIFPKLKELVRAVGLPVRI